MDIKKGDLVTRISHDNDMVFKVVNIKNGIFYLKGVEERLYADSPMEDLNPYTDENKEEEPKEPEDLGEAENPIGDINSTGTGSNNSSSAKDKPKYKGYDVVGTMRIPVINFDYPILDNPGAIETSVAMLYGAGINKVGNTFCNHNLTASITVSDNM